jgi:hypothetical protein
MALQTDALALSGGQSKSTPRDLNAFKGTFVAFRKIHMILTVADHRAALRVAHVLILVWPIVLTGIIAIAKRRRLQHPFAFMFLGYLICCGMFFVVSQVEAQSGWIHTAAATPTDKLMSYLMIHLIETTAASFVTCLLPVLWLYKLLASARIT